jgi:hypothetical protein
MRTCVDDASAHCEWQSVNLQSGPEALLHGVCTIWQTFEVHVRLLSKIFKYLDRFYFKRSSDMDAGKSRTVESVRTDLERVCVTSDAACLCMQLCMKMFVDSILAIREQISAAFSAVVTKDRHGEGVCV